MLELVPQLDIIQMPINTMEHIDRNNCRGNIEYCFLSVEVVVGFVDVGADVDDLFVEDDHALGDQDEA